MPMAGELTVDPKDMSSVWPTDMSSSMSTSSQGDEAYSAMTNSLTTSAPKKKRKSWGQQLPKPTTNLPPRKRAKTDEEKQQRLYERVQRNRQAAHNSRIRKQDQMEAVVKENNALKQNVHFLQQEVERLKVENARLSGKSYPPPEVDFTPALDSLIPRNYLGTPSLTNGSSPANPSSPAESIDEPYMPPAPEPVSNFVQPMIMNASLSNDTHSAVDVGRASTSTRDGGNWDFTTRDMNTAMDLFNPNNMDDVNNTFNDFVFEEYIMDPHANDDSTATDDLASYITHDASVPADHIWNTPVDDILRCPANDNADMTFQSPAAFANSFADAQAFESLDGQI